MRPQTLLPLVAGVFVVAVVAFVAIVLAGGGDDPVPAPTATAAVTPGGDVTPGEFGPEPTLGGNVLDLIPEHGQTVESADTVPDGPNSVGGVCAFVSFEGLPEANRLLWFQFAVDAEIVTNQLVVFALENGNDATLCYQPPAPLTPGRHTAAVSVVDPSNPNANVRQLVGWEWDVE